LAKKQRKRLFDVRKPPADLPIASGKALSTGVRKILTVGTDASIGKMTTSLALLREAEKRGDKAKFIATGQTGIMIAGEGICIDAVVADFVAGAVEEMVLEACEKKIYDYLLIEGQGAIAHPGFSGVTLALIHGSCPDSMVLCHQVTRHTMRNLPFKVPSLVDSISAYEHMAALIRPAKVLAIALDTRGLAEDEALKAIAKATEQTGLPANDPVRFGTANILDAVLAHREHTFVSHSPN
jgi:uncharacterized NAD-dependent epimerase/dehydratase family protein